jgi:hypothetical protein
MENAIKNKIKIEQAEVLACCFLNKNTIDSVYGYDTENEINKNCPEMFKNDIKVPSFYMDLVKSKVK